MLQKGSIIKIFEIFADEPTREHYLIEISKKSKLAHTSTKKLLNELLKESLIIERIDKKGKRKYPMYSANLNNLFFKRYKFILNVQEIYDSGIVDYLRDKFAPNCIMLFGSFSRGEDIENSDIDIFINSKKGDASLEKFEKKLNRKIQLHFNENFSNYSNELKNNILNGIRLYGYLEAFK